VQRQRAIALACAGALLAGTPAAAQAAGVPRHVASAQTVAVLLANHAVYAKPGGTVAASVAGHRPITGERTALPVLASRTHGSSRWLLVRLPGRPNGHTGWIKAGGVKLEAIKWYIFVSLGARRAWIYYAGRVVRKYAVIVGTPATPTPQGRFFVEENIAEPSYVPGAPYALALSARSNVFSEFDGGPGQIALHGIANLGGTLGTAESHGCVRFATAAISWLAKRISPGTPVTISG
jgi:lipoprotein-anchoring transpeptidase ErfK/SrfK